MEMVAVSIFCSPVWTMAPGDSPAFSDIFLTKRGIG
jgi:hypothetical protein